MTVVIDGDTGITSVNGTAAAPSITGVDTDTGIVYGTNTLSLATGGTTAVTVSSSQNVTLSAGLQVGGIGTNVYPLVAGTAVAASGTSVTFTGIPSWVRRITVMVSGLSSNSTSPYLVQIGDSGGIETSGYAGAVSFGGGGATYWFSTGFNFFNTQYAATLHSGNITLTHLGSNTWTETSNVAQNVTGVPFWGAGAKTLSDTLTQVRVTTVNGTDTFDAGTLNILYE